MTPPVAIKPHIQLSPAHCAVAALAAYLNVPYEQVSEVARGVKRRVIEDGLTKAEIRAVARRLRRPLSLKRGRPQESSVGLLLMDCGNQTSYHCVVLFQSIVIDPSDGVVWDAETYLEGKIVRAFLTEEDE